jgi:hypothetical protein
LFRLHLQWNRLQSPYPHCRSRNLKWLTKGSSRRSAPGAARFMREECRSARRRNLLRSHQKSIRKTSSRFAHRVQKHPQPRPQPRPSIRLQRNLGHMRRSPYLSHQSLDRRSRPNRHDTPYRQHLNRPLRASHLSTLRLLRLPRRRRHWRLALSRHRRPRRCVPRRPGPQLSSE